MQQYNTTRRPYNAALDAAQRAMQRTHTIFNSWSFRRYHSLAIGSGRSAHLAGIDTKHAPEASEASDQDCAHADLKIDLCRKGELLYAEGAQDIVPKGHAASCRGRAVVVMNWWHSGHCISVG
jgi:hypothetical protein